MAKPLDPSALIPAGFVVDEVVIEADRWVVRAHGAAHSSNCPACGQPSTRVHSRYRRHLADLPSAGRRVHLEIVARKFRCIGINCRRRIFAERFSIVAYCVMLAVQICLTLVARRWKVASVHRASAVRKAPEPG